MTARWFRAANQVQRFNNFWTLSLCGKWLETDSEKHHTCAALGEDPYTFANFTLSYVRKQLTAKQMASRCFRSATKHMAVKFSDSRIFGLYTTLRKIIRNCFRETSHLCSREKIHTPSQTSRSIRYPKTINCKTNGSPVFLGPVISDKLHRDYWWWKQWQRTRKRYGMSGTMVPVIIGGNDTTDNIHDRAFHIIHI
jgi:hypothetical protein